jgi:hypothetical protein
MTAAPTRAARATRRPAVLDAERTDLVELIAQDAVSVGAHPARFPTPQSTVDAVVHCVRERGVGALKRLSRCDAAAKDQINRRIDALLERGRTR